MTERCLIIAEAGVNHNGDIELAKRLIDEAATAGADIVKFQTFSADRLVTNIAPKADYQNRTTGSAESQADMLTKLELTPEMHELLLAHCKLKGIEFFSTGFDVESLDYLHSIGLSRFKVPSGEITNLPYLRHLAWFGKPIILSTGMANLGEIEAAIDVLESGGLKRQDITVLHCNTEYPTPMADVNLRAMSSIRDAFDVAVGYSDHTLGIEVPISAVALGATVIEKHLTLDRDLTGPDHRASLEPGEFAEMVRCIRNIEMALGSRIKHASPSELKNRSIVRKSLVAKRAIRTGETFSRDNVTAKRPGNGISPMRWDEVINRYARRDFAIDDLIEL
uniref:N-acetylneuraminate synthase n=1 Tax=Orrella sp. TaxID=1921583 RepID=UPI004048E53F